MRGKAEKGRDQGNWRVCFEAKQTIISREKEKA